MKNRLKQSNCGLVLENELLEKLKCLPNVIRIYTEKELTKLYGWDASSVDFMIEFNNYTILIQTKYLKTRRKENFHINKFVKSINYLKKVHNLNLFYGIWVCRIHPFDDNISYLHSNRTDVVSCFESINLLVNKTIDHIIDQSLVF
jgi:hypothetical protein